MLSDSKSGKWFTGFGIIMAAVIGVTVLIGGLVLAGITLSKSVSPQTTVSTTQISGNSGIRTAAGTAAASASTAPASAAAVSPSAAEAGKPAAAASQSSGNDIQYIKSTMTSGGYPSITVKAGIPVEWTIHANKGSINGCNNVMELTDFGLEVQLKEGDNLIRFTPDKTGKIQYSCWMGMTYGLITVE